MTVSIGSSGPGAAGAPGPAAALAVLRRAAQTAPSASALELLDTALALMDADDPDRYALLVAKARVLVTMGASSAAVAETTSLVPQASDLTSRLGLHVTEVLARMAPGGDAEPVPSIDDWLAELDLAPEDLTAGDALAMAEYALVQLVTGHPVGAGRTMALVPPADDEVARILVDTARTVGAMYRGRMDDAVEGAAAVRTAVERTDRLAEVVGYVPLAGCGAVLARAGRVAEGRAAIAAAHSTARAFGLAWTESLCDANLAAVLLDAGQWDDALAVVDGGLAAAEEHGQLAYAPWLLAVRALVLARRGDLDGAERAWAQAAQGNAVLFNGFDHLQWAEATIASARRDDRAAQDALEVLADAVVRSGVAYLPPPMALDLVRARLAVGDRAGAAHAATWLPRSATSAVVGAFSSAAQGLLGGEPRRLSEAADAVAPSFPHEAARLWEDAAALAPAAPGDALDRAVAAYRDLGAASDLERLRRRVPGAPVGTEPAPAPGLDALTRTERRVTDLVAAGCSNTEIADQLSVSRRTVESHLRRIFAKVGVRSRLQLAVLVQASPT